MTRRDHTPLRDWLADFYSHPDAGCADARYLRTRPAYLAAMIRSKHVSLPSPQEAQ